MILASEITHVRISTVEGRIAIRKGSFELVKARMESGGPMESWWKAVDINGNAVSGPREHLVMVEAKK